MFRKLFNRKLSYLAAMLMSVPASAAVVNDLGGDIELYVKHNVQNTETPRVMILFDTSGSMMWSVADGSSCGYDDDENQYIECSDSRLSVAKTAIIDLIDSSPDIDFGLMRFRNSSGSGGYVLSALGTAHATIKSKINAIVADGSTPLSETAYETYLYLSGGNMKYGDNVSSSWRDTSVDNGSSYTAAFTPETDVDGTAILRCDNTINVIMMTDGDPTSDTGVNDEIKALFPANDQPTSIATYQGYENYLHGLAKYMANNDLYAATPAVEETARTYTIAFGTGMSTQGKALLEEAAKQGLGTYLPAEDATALSTALKKTLEKIREVNDTFTSPSVASSQSDRTQSLDSVYYAMFYPKTSARWPGNVKKLQLVGDKVVDLDKADAIDSGGAIVENAKTFWLPTDELPDGNVVAKGGVNLHLSSRSFSKVYTDVGTGTPMPKFNKTNAKIGAGGTNAALATHMGIAKAQTLDYINWSRGIDIEKTAETGSTVKRTDILGDPLHSKPAAINYGDGATYLLFGTNAGYVHMFKDSGNTVKEMWAFIPYELYPIIKPLKENTAETKVYGMDLTPTIYFDDADGNGVVDTGDKVWAFFGMRRGGRSYYAFDITTPSSPTLLWANPITPSSSGMSNLGFTFSEPTVTFIDVDGYKDKPLLVFGGGYDKGKDNIAKTDDSMGNAIYIVDAETGTLVWSLSPGATGGTNTNFPGKHSVPGSIAVLDSDYDGYTDRLYAADTNGSVWRVDMPGSDPQSSDDPWTVFELAYLGGATKATDRRFFYQPEVARTYFSRVTTTDRTDANGTVTSITRQETPYEAVVIGSGNRAKPSDTEAANFLYMIRDENVITKSFDDVSSVPAKITQDKLMDMDETTFGSLLTDAAAFAKKEAEYGGFNGWKYSLATAEKALAKPAIIGGVAYFPTFTPSPDASANQCSLSGGTGSIYAFHLHYGVKVYDTLKIDAGDRIPPTPQMVFNNNADGDSQFLLIGIGGGEQSGVIKAKSIEDSAVPRDKDGDGTLDLIGSFAGFKTHRSYIFREESNKVN